MHRDILPILFVLAAACGGDIPCDPESSGDCSGGQTCLWGPIGGESGYVCAIDCGGPGDCGAGETCDPVASSCQACDDIRSICR
jgi:hypothetical protein